MHFTYTDKIDRSCLHQGDILERTPEINQLLQLVHPHFHAKVDNLYFMVLTQTCDLVLRGSRSAPKAEYIVVCPVRPLERVLARAMKNFVVQSAGIPVGTNQDRQRFEDFLVKLFNNNQQNLFYLQAGDGFLSSDCCAITTLAISIKSELHYHSCLAAKRMQLNDVFEAKLGWLVGNTYSRVGTQDWDAAEIKGKISAVLGENFVWVQNSKERDQFVAMIEEAQRNAGALDATILSRLRKSLPSKKEKVLGAVDRIIQAEGLNEQTVRTLQKKLANDPELATLLRS